MDDERRPILEHLEELRRRIIFSLLAVILLSALSYMFAGRILEAFAGYVGTLVFISPEEAFLSYVKISLFSGIIPSTPVLFFNIFRFAWIALRKKEKASFAACVALGVFLFITGAAFAYCIALPAAIRFLLAFSSEMLRPFISVSRYIGFSVFLVLAFSVAFETPLFTVILTKAGLVSAEMLRKKRPYFIVLIFVVAALLTPPDVITQVLLAGPLLVLYEISILLARLTERRPR